MKTDVSSARRDPSPKLLLSLIGTLIAFTAVAIRLAFLPSDFWCDAFTIALAANVCALAFLLFRMRGHVVLRAFVSIALAAFVWLLGWQAYVFFNAAD